MKIGLYLAALMDHSLEGALDKLVEWGLTEAEVPAGGFNPYDHCNPGELVASAEKRSEFLQVFDEKGINLAILNANSNPLHPDPEVHVPHRKDLFDAIELSSQLGLSALNAMVGSVGSGPGATLPTWSLVPWESGLLEVRDYQMSIAVPFWKEAAARAEHFGVDLALEIHPHMVTYNPGSLERFIDAVGSDRLGVNLDPSHLFWQGIDPSRFAARFAGRVWHVAAKDTVLVPEAIAEYGILDDRYTYIDAAEKPQPLGGRYLTTQPPMDGPWHFVAAGRGHDTAWWADFLANVRAAGFNGAVCIENEDWDLPREESIPIAAQTLTDALALSPATTA